jgi:Zn-dependent protease
VPGRGIRLGEPYGIPIRLHLSFVVLGALVVIVLDPVLHNERPAMSDAGVHSLAITVALGLLLSVAIHEFAHAVMARRLGMQVRGIHLWGLGGSTALDGEPATARAQYLISVVGPLTNVLLGGIGAAVWASTSAGSIPYELGLRIAAANALLAVYNLLPGLPLDGGQMLRAGVWALTGDKITGLRAAGYGGFVAAGATVALAVVESRSGGDYGLFTLLVAVFIAVQALQAVRSASIARRLPMVVAGRLARPAHVVADDLPVAEALRRATAAGHCAVVYRKTGQADLVLSEALLAAVPEIRRPWVPLSSVVTAASPLDASLAGEDLLSALRCTTQGEHVVMSGSRLVGVLRVADVAAALTRSAPVRSGV